MQTNVMNILLNKYFFLNLKTRIFSNVKSLRILEKIKLEKNWIYPILLHETLRFWNIFSTKKLCFVMKAQYFFYFLRFTEGNFYNMIFFFLHYCAFMSILFKLTNKRSSKFAEVSEISARSTTVLKTHFFL